MRKFILLIASLLIFSCCESKELPSSKDAKQVIRQQSQYAKGQPIPAFNWSLERHLLVQLYRVRNQKVATHSVWRSNTGMVEGDCPSYGYGLPYDTSLTNPLVATNTNSKGDSRGHGAMTSIEQPEPNGIFASKNTSATWVMCLGASGKLEPIYIETKVTVYPGPVIVDYEKNTVRRSGAATVLIRK